jgi:hypothetical protein
VIDAIDLHVAWQAAQTLLVLAMLAVMWRLHRRLDSLRAARDEATEWLEQFSKLIARTETVLRQARQPAPVPVTHVNEAKRDASERNPDSAPRQPESVRPSPADPARRAAPDAATGAKIARLEDILGRLR